MHNFRWSLLPILLGAPFPFACGQQNPTDDADVDVKRQLLPNELATIPRAVDDPTGAANEVLFQSVRVLDAEGKEVSARHVGNLTVAQWQRSARPWTHLDDPYVYNEQAWSQPTENGMTEFGYRVVRVPSPARPTPASVPAPPELGPGVLARASGSEPVEVSLRIRNHREWDIPLRPPAELFAPGEQAAALANRNDAI